jgi:hypothetical protein
MKTNTLFQNVISIFYISIFLLCVSCSKEQLVNEIKLQNSTTEELSGQRSPDIIIWPGVYNGGFEQDEPLVCLIAEGVCMIDVIERSEAYPIDDVPAVILFRADTVYRILTNKSVLDTLNIPGGYKVTLKDV